MTVLAHQQEILAEDVEAVPGALWTQDLLDETRVTEAQVPELVRIVVALDPAATSRETSDEMGIIAGGKGDGRARLHPPRCLHARDARRLCPAGDRVFDALEADLLMGEVNNGGEWIGAVIQFVAAEMHRQRDRPSPSVPYKMLDAARGKQTRAQPVSASVPTAVFIMWGTFRSSKPSRRSGYQGSPRRRAWMRRCGSIPSCCWGRRCHGICRWRPRSISPRPPSRRGPAVEQARGARRGPSRRRSAGGGRSRVTKRRISDDRQAETPT